MDIRSNFDIFQSVLNNLHEGVLITDAKNKVIYVNDAYTRVTGIEKSEIITTDLSQSRPGSQMKKVLENGQPLFGVYRNYGNREHISNIVPIYKNGELFGGASIAYSISDLKDISELLENNLKKLEKLQSQIDNMRITKYCFDDIIALNSNSIETKMLAIKLAKKDIPILILGESGTGKEVYAQAIHDASHRREYSFIAINCSAISSTLVESELFGYVGNAFSGAKREGQKGIFEAAEGGTVFLDEIGELDVNLQAKLLRVLQESSVRPVGGTKEKK